MANSGFEKLTSGFNSVFTENFAAFDYIVCPSGSRTLHIKDHLHEQRKDNEILSIRNKIFELTEFLVDILEVKNLTSVFSHTVSIHQSCHGQRGLKLAQMSELVAPPFSKTETLLKMVKGITLNSPTRKDECCGFGGTFCVSEEAVSVKMGKDRILDHLNHGTEYITASDMSCLMHVEGIIKRNQITISEPL